MTCSTDDVALLQEAAMQDHHLHVDEIDALAWIAAAAFGLLLLTALLLGPTQKLKVATDLTPPTVPTVPALPPAMTTDPRA
jgi:hypothetical protein